MDLQIFNMTLIADHTEKSGEERQCQKKVVLPAVMGLDRRGRLGKSLAPIKRPKNCWSVQKKTKKERRTLTSPKTINSGMRGVIARKQGLSITFKKKIEAGAKVL